MGTNNEIIELAPIFSDPTESDPKDHDIDENTIPQQIQLIENQMDLDNVTYINTGIDYKGMGLKMNYSSTSESSLKVSQTEGNKRPVKQLLPAAERISNLNPVAYKSVVRKKNERKKLHVINLLFLLQIIL